MIAWIEFLWTKGNLYYNNFPICNIAFLFSEQNATNCSIPNVIQTFIELELLLLLEPSSLLSLCSTDCLLIIRSLFDWRLPYKKGIIGSHNTLILIRFFVQIRDSSIVILYIDSIDADILCPLPNYCIIQNAACYNEMWSCTQYQHT